MVPPSAATPMDFSARTRLSRGSDGLVTAPWLRVRERTRYPKNGTSFPGCGIDFSGVEAGLMLPRTRFPRLYWACQILAPNVLTIVVENLSELRREKRDGKSAWRGPLRPMP